MGVHSSGLLHRTETNHRQSCVIDRRHVNIDRRRRPTTRRRRSKFGGGGSSVAHLPQAMLINVRSFFSDAGHVVDARRRRRRWPASMFTETARSFEDDSIGVPSLVLRHPTAYRHLRRRRVDDVGRRGTSRGRTSRRVLRNACVCLMSIFFRSFSRSDFTVVIGQTVRNEPATAVDGGNVGRPGVAHHLTFHLNRVRPIAGCR